MKKRLLSFIVVMFLMMLPVACSWGNDAVTIRVAHVFANSHVQARAIKMWADLVEERSGGKIQMDIYSNGQMGSEREVSEMVVQGTMDVSMAGGGAWAAFAGKAAIWALPYLFHDLDHQQRVMDVTSDFCQKVLNDVGLTYLGYYTSGINVTLTNSKPLYTAEDIVGLKIRVPETAVFVETWTAMKANTITTPWSEAYTSMQTGLVEAVDSNIESLHSIHLEEVGKYISATNQLAPPFMVVINTNKWNTLNPEQQKIVKDAMAESTAWQIKAMAKTLDDALAAMEAKGVVYNEMNEGEIEKLTEMCKPVHDNLIQQYDAQDILDAILAVE